MTGADQERLWAVTDALEPALVSGSLPAVASSVATLRHAIARFARTNGFASPDVDRVALAVSEAAANVVLHAYPAGRSGVMSYVADVAADDLQVVITDEGRGIRKDHTSEGLGLGLTVIAQMASDFGIYAREPRGLEVWMRFLPE